MIANCILNHLNHHEVLIHLGSTATAFICIKCNWILQKESDLTWKVVQTL